MAEPAPTPETAPPAAEVAPPVTPPVAPPATPPPVPDPVAPGQPDPASIADQLAAAIEAARDAYMARDAARGVAKTHETTVNELRDQLTAAEQAAVTVARTAELTVAAAKSVDPETVVALLAGKEGDPETLVAALLAEKPYLAAKAPVVVPDLTPPPPADDPYAALTKQIADSRS